jgi:hypothetical protein
MFTPDVQTVGKLLASKKDIVDAFDSYSNDPAVVSLIARYTSGDEEAGRLIGEAVARYSTLVSLFTYLIIRNIGLKTSSGV